jgi:hypothetical protein
MKLMNKTTIGKIAVGVMLALSLNACKKDSNNTPANTADSVSEADAVEMTTDAVASGTGGMTAQVSSSVSLYKTVTINCGETKDTSIAASSLSGITPSYSISFSWSYVLNCSGGAPNNLVFNFNGNSNYTGAKMILSGTTKGTFTLSGLPSTASDYTLNYSYTRGGSLTSMIGQQHHYTSSVVITGNNITIDKTTGLIVSGTGTVNIMGTSSSGSSFSFQGSITFNGGNTASLVLNSGTKYTIQM